MALWPLLQVYTKWVKKLQYVLNGVGQDLNSIIRASNNVVMNAAGLAIQGAGNAAFKTANTIKYLIDGAYFTKAATASITFSANTPVLGNNNSCCFLVQVDSGGNFSTKAGTVIAAAAVGSVVPPPDAGKAAVGLINIACGAAGTFTPNTTALDNANITTTYTDLIGSPESGLAVTPTAPTTFPRLGTVGGADAASIDATNQPDTLEMNLS